MLEVHVTKSHEVVISSVSLELTYGTACTSHCTYPYAYIVLFVRAWPSGTSLLCIGSGSGINPIQYVNCMDFAGTRLK